MSKTSQSTILLHDSTSGWSSPPGKRLRLYRNQDMSSPWSSRSDCLANTVTQTPPSLRTSQDPVATRARRVSPVRHGINWPMTFHPSARRAWRADHLSHQDHCRSFLLLRLSQQPTFWFVQSWLIKNASASSWLIALHATDRLTHDGRKANSFECLKGEDSWTMTLAS